MSLFLLFTLRIPDKGLTKNLLFRLQIVFLTTLEHRKQANFQLLTAWLVHFLSTFRPSHLNCLPVWPCRLLPLLHPSSSDCNTPFLDLPHQQLNNAASYLTNKPSPVTPATCVAVLRPLFVACFLFTLLVLPQLWSSYKWYCVLNTATQDSISSQSCLKCWNWEVLCYCMTQSLANVHSRYLQPPASCPRPSRTQTLRSQVYLRSVSVSWNFTDSFSHSFYSATPAHTLLSLFIFNLLNNQQGTSQNANCL